MPAGITEQPDADLFQEAFGRNSRPGNLAADAGLGDIATSVGKSAEDAIDPLKKMKDALAETVANASEAQSALGSYGDAVDKLRTQQEKLTLALLDNAISGDQYTRANDAIQQQITYIDQLKTAYGGVSAEIAQQLNTLSQQTALAQARNGAEQINLQYQQTITNLMGQGKTAAEATAVAEAQRALSLAQINAGLDQQLKSLQEQAEVMRGATDLDKARIKAAQDYQKAVDAGADSLKAGAVAAQTIANARMQQDAQEMATAEADAARASEQRAASNARAAEQADREADQMDRMVAAAREYARIRAFIPSFIQDSELFTNKDGTKSQFGGSVNDNLYAPGTRSGTASGGYTSGTTFLPAKTAAEVGAGLWGAGNVDANGMPTSEILYNTAAQQLFSGLGAKDAALLLAGGVDPSRSGELLSRNSIGLASQGFNEQSTTQATNNLMSLLQGGRLSFQRGSQDRWGGEGASADFAVNLASQEGQTVMNRLLSLLPDADKIGVLEAEIAKISQSNPTIARDEIIMSLTEQLKQLKDATDANTDATSAMTDVLSPFYSSDPRSTHLGFRSFAGGGIMTADGMLPLRQYAGGGIANSPQMSVFGEGSTPEAYVPVPSGRIPVEMKGPANSNQRPIQVTINVHGNADMGTVAALKKTAFQQTQSMRRALG